MSRIPAPGEGIDMYAYDSDGNLLAHQFNSGGGNLVAFSFATPIIARLDMYPILQGIDDFVFNTPQAVPHPGDVDNNGVVDVDDLLEVINSWGKCPAPCPADFNCNGVVDVDDLLIAINNWS
jgi:hypothetical protein